MINSARNYVIKADLYSHQLARFDELARQLGIRNALTIGQRVGNHIPHPRVIFPASAMTQAQNNCITTQIYSVFGPSDIIIAYWSNKCAVLLVFLIGQARHTATVVKSHQA